MTVDATMRAINVARALIFDLFLMVWKSQAHPERPIIDHCNRLKKYSVESIEEI